MYGENFYQPSSEPHNINHRRKFSEREEHMKDTIDILKHLGLTNTQTSSFRCEFKIQGIINPKSETKLTYLSLCSQITEGRRKGYRSGKVHYLTRRRS